MPELQRKFRVTLSTIVLPLVPILLIAIVVYLWFIPSFKQALIRERKLLIRSQVESIVSAIDALNEQVKAGELTERSARNQVIHLVDTIRYGPDGKSYFWIHTPGNVMVIHPNRPEYNGLHASEMPDEKMSRLMAHFNSVIRQAGQGYIEYKWQYQDQAQTLEDKISYVKLYKPWGWVVGTGVYWDDLEEDFQKMVVNFTLIGLGAILITSLITAVIIHNNYRNRRRQQQLERQKSRLTSRYEDLFNSSNDALILFSAEDVRIVRVNKRALEMFAVEQESDVIGATPEEFASENQSDSRFSTSRIRFFFKRIVRQNKSQIAQWRLKTRTGKTFEAQVSASLHMTEEAPYILISIRDISDMVQYQKSLEEMQLVLEKRLAEIESLNEDLLTFDYSVNNALLVPLRHIAGYANILDETAGDDFPEETRRYLERMLNSTENLKRLLENLKSLSRATKQKMKMGRLDLASIARTEMAVIRKDFSDKEIAFDLPERLAIRGDHSLMQMALQHVFRFMINNCFKTDTPTIELGIAEGHSNLFYISDNCERPLPESVDDIFKPFHAYHTSDSFQGTGLRMAIVARIVQRHGGRIWAEKHDGSGLTIYFSLPEH